MNKNVFTVGQPTVMTIMTTSKAVKCLKFEPSLGDDEPTQDAHLQVLSATKPLIRQALMK